MKGQLYFIMTPHVTQIVGHSFLKLLNVSVISSLSHKRTDQYSSKTFAVITTVGQIKMFLIIDPRAGYAAGQWTDTSCT